MLMAAMLAMVLAAAAPAFAQDTTTEGSIVEECLAVLNQTNEGSQYAVNEQT